MVYYHTSALPRYVDDSYYWGDYYLRRQFHAESEYKASPEMRKPGCGRVSSAQQYAKHQYNNTLRSTVTFGVLDRSACLTE